jgi:phosphoglycerate kinase
MAKRTVRDLDVAHKRVLIRADFNVPLESARITDDRRIRQFLPTLEHVLERNGRAILMSHLGRPTGDPQKDRGLSLRPVSERVSELIGKACAFVENCVGQAAEKAAGALGDGDVLLLENLRFHTAETIIDKKKENADGRLTPQQEEMRREFAEGLARLADVYVNDAFGTCHRNHVSMYDVPALLGEGKRAIGFLVEKELWYLDRALHEPKRPFVAVLGGAKVSDKIGVIRNLAGRVDHILIGGAMMFTFWAAQDRGVGRSLCERDKLDLARDLLKEIGDKLHLPSDCVAANELKQGVATQVAEGEVPGSQIGLDVGPKTIEAYRRLVSDARTIVWNGPMGAFEVEPFDKGTVELARGIAEATDKGAISVIGGGDSAAAVEQAGLAERMTHISTGGGASLKFLEGKTFDPIEIIDVV